LEDILDSEDIIKEFSVRTSTGTSNITTLKIMLFLEVGRSCNTLCVTMTENLNV